MSHASAALPPFPLLRFPAVRVNGRATLALLSGAVQAMGFAAVMWLLLAGPGLMADLASTVPGP